MAKWIVCKGARPDGLGTGPIEIKHRFGQVKQVPSADDVTDWSHHNPPSPSDIGAARPIEISA